MGMLTFTFMQQALVACIVVCAVAPLVGTFVVQRRQSLVGDGLGHVAFAGVGLAFLSGASPLLGALGLTLVAAIALYRLQHSGIGGDLALALVFYGGIALGFLFISRAGMGFNTVVGFLFGSPLNLTWPTVWAIVALSGLVTAVVAALYGPLVAVSFDEQAARVSGVPVSGLTLALTLAVALIVVGGMQALGLLLVAAMMVVPVAAATQVARSYRGTMAIASSIGAGSAVLGLFVAFYADSTPAASIVLTAIACYLVAAAGKAVRHRVAARVA